MELIFQNKGGPFFPSDQGGIGEWAHRPSFEGWVMRCCSRESKSRSLDGKEASFPLW